MSRIRNPNSIRVGLVASEPIRVEGLTSIFERYDQPGQPQLIPVVGSLQDLLADPSIEYLVVELIPSAGGVGYLDNVRQVRPSLRLIVIGPEANESLVLDSIIAGARAYLDFSASPRMVRQALDVVISGSIWAPRRLLSKLIDRLLSTSDSSPTNSSPHLTARERQVLELILKARSNREIAHELGIEERTVKSHVGRLMRKTGSDNRIALSMRALSGAFHPRLGPFEYKRNTRPSD